MVNFSGKFKIPRRYCEGVFPWCCKQACLGESCPWLPYRRRKRRSAQFEEGATDNCVSARRGGRLEWRFAPSQHSTNIARRNGSTPTDVLEYLPLHATVHSGNRSIIAMERLLFCLYSSSSA